MPFRATPNILVAGTPGTGKSTLCKKVARKVEGLTVLDFGKEAEAHGCREGYDDTLDCWIVDEEKLSDALTSRMQLGGTLVDYMHANFWPEPSLIDLVVTLHTDNTVLYDRYIARGYSAQKIEQNMDCEIMNVIGSENEEYFGLQEDEDEEEEEERTTTVVELFSNDDKDMKRNVKSLVKWVGKWKMARESAGKDEHAMPRCIVVDNEGEV